MNKKSQEEVIEAIRAASTGNEVLTQTQFFKNSNITISDVLRYFPKWSDACRAAGVEYDTTRDRVPDEDVLADWGRVTRDLGHVPALNEYKVFGKYSREVFNRFGKWVDLPDVFSKHFAGSDGWEDVLVIVEQFSPKPKIRKIIEPRASHPSAVVRWHMKLESRPIYGDPIDFRGLRHEPVNEQGVVFLFGMVARELGYLVEAIQGGFPDCEAKRQISKGQWQPVQVEFEYESKNFVDHGHDPTKCDVIICWIHNWMECPDNLEVLELSEVIKKLPPK
jgi:hypothetical protein